MVHLTFRTFPKLGEPQNNTKGSKQWKTVVNQITNLPFENGFHQPFLENMK